MSSFRKVLLSILLGVGALAAAASELAVQAIDIREQPLAAALNEWARQTGLMVLAPEDEGANSIRVLSVQGILTPGEALERLLKGLPYRYRFVNERTVSVYPEGSDGMRAEEPIAQRPTSSGGVMLAQADMDDAGAEGKERKIAKGEEGEGAQLEEIVVTGTHIRGRAPQASPLTVVTRQDIERTGYTNVSDLMASIPQNFAGLSSGTNYSGRANDAGNAAYGTAVDLRGLGGDTTLVLVNGHRLAPSGYYGAMTDISVIPLSAIERVEILTDGASAIYGSDAVGGVVNYILREDFTGSETSLLYGVAAGGVRDEYRAAQSFGTRWARGHALLSYEFFEQEALRASDRSFASGAEPGDLTPKSRQHSAFLATSQTMSDTWELKGAAFYADRANDFDAYVFGFPRPIDAGTQQYSLALDNDIEFNSAWDLELGASYAVNETTTESDTPLFGPGGADSDARFITLDAQVNGALGTISGGEVRTAIGTQYRSERFERVFSGSFVSAGPNLDERRNIRAVFAELAIPLVGEANRRRGIERLDLNIAGRYERYSDFGSTFDPKLGVSWLAAPSVLMRGTVGTSFKAPNFQQLLGGGFAILENSADPLAPGGISPTLVVFGQNPGLDAQEATQWTAGFDFTPQSVPGLQLGATYFDIDFEGRLAAPRLPELDAASRPEDQDFMRRDPSLDEVTALVNAVGPTNFFDITGIPGLDPGPPRTLADVTVIADGRVQNIASTDMRGLDVALSFERQASELEYELGLSGTYLFEFEDLARSGATPVTALNRFGQPVKLKLRSNGTVSRGSLSATLALNHVSDYTNDTALPAPVPVSSWTTADLQLRYQGNWDVALSCLNLLDKEPPFIPGSNLSAPIGYDAANAHPFGRIVSLRVKRMW